MPQHALPPHTLQAWLHDDQEIALFDVREAGQYGAAHLLHACPLPYSRLEVDIGRLAPNRAIRTVLYDGGEDPQHGAAARARRRLAALGYADVRVLEGGTRAWAAAGLPLFAGVHVPSKAFGEMVEHRYRTPSVGPQALQAWLREPQPPVVIDGRPPEEHHTMCIPGAVCCPNGELALRIRAIVPDPATPIVVSCAGRTRSIIGAQTLRELALPNPVFALENGTQGWFLADLPLEHGATRRHPDAVAATADARDAARHFARRCGVATENAATLEAWLGDAARTTLVFDIRTAEEYAADGCSGSRHAPGGQLIQATDQFVGVRGARIVLLDTDGTRAPVVAGWLRRMGRDAHCVAGEVRALLARHAAESTQPELPAVPGIDAEDLQRSLPSPKFLVLDMRSSAAYRKAHVPGAKWRSRSQLNAGLDAAEIVLVADDPAVAACAAIDLREAGFSTLRQLEGGWPTWLHAGAPTESTPDRPADADRIDFLFFAHDRHRGNKEAARQYLRWETELLSQFDASDHAAMTRSLDTAGAAA
ncbi:rhodanese-like domain-containing protein [Variovorax boronicumulans]|uniref:rhodanese-like domain-containing protein n=1 Tax=Variovorax boronicumulans TaxID=436515 RepID=UPI001C58AAFA